MKEIIKKGDKYGRLTAVRFDHRNKRGLQHWLFKCECGVEKTIGVNEVKMKKSKSCGCSRIIGTKNSIIEKGQKFNKLTAIKFVETRGNSQQYWLFKCECGNEKVIWVGGVKFGRVKSCGCLWKKIMTNHGMWKTRIYKSWGGMKQRCLNPKATKFKDYGGRGIKVCDRWLKFENFFEDMGEMPENKTLDRIDNNGNYNKSNCKWSTRKEQSNNQRRTMFITHKGKTQTIAQWSKELGINRHKLYCRIWKGWSVKRALTFNI